jgi:endoglucanase
MPRSRSSVALGALALCTALTAAGCRDRGRPAAAPSPAKSDAPATSVANGASSASGASDGSTSGPITGWLDVKGNRIRLPNGRPFHGRGANIHDTRSCDACDWEPAHVEEVFRRIDSLTDDWNATLVRLLLESYPNDGHAKIGTARTHYKNVLDDDDYFHDVMRMVGHVGAKKGVYVLLSLWQDPTFTQAGWPSGRTAQVWKKLAGALRDMPFVMFGLVNEPQSNDDGKRDPEVWKAMNDTVAAIRSVERPDHHHVITVQGTRDWGRSLDYYLDHPITAGGGGNIAYETHVYNRATRFDDLVTRPARKLPVIVGEFGPRQDQDVTMFPDDCKRLMDLAEKLDVPWIAWTFHTNCPPNLLVERKETCGVGAPLEPSAWGRVVKSRLAHPW